MNDEVQILNYTNQLQARLVQKYLERIYICKNEKYPQLLNKKFDLRLWVLVKSFNPLVVYSYKSGYLRLCSQEYDLNDTRNTYSHFTNFSINKYIFLQNNNVQNSAIDLKVFKKLVETEHGINFDKQIQPKINSIIVHSLKSVQQKIKQHASCFEIYGFDIIFDEQINPYLLEVNLSPACQKRSEFIQQLQKEMFLSTLNLLFNTSHKEIQNWQRIDINHQPQLKQMQAPSQNQLNATMDQQSQDFDYITAHLKQSQEQAAIVIQKFFKIILLRK